MRRVLEFTCGVSCVAAGLAWTAACGGPAFTTVPADAGVEAATAPDHWCAGRADLFCEDFDEQASVTPFLSTWTTSQANGGTFLFDTSDTVPSPPNALRVTGSNGAQVIVVQIELLMPEPKTIRLGFELRINSPGSVGVLSAAGFAALAYGEHLSNGYVAMALGSGPSIEAIWFAAAGLDADAGTFQASRATGAFPASMTWAGRYALEVDYKDATSAGCMQVYSGPTALLTTCLPLPPSLSSPSVLSIALGDYAGGLLSTGTTGDIDIEFDNVTFDVTY